MNIFNVLLIRSLKVF